MPQLDTAQAEFVAAAVERWGDYAPVFAELAQRLTISRAEAVAYATWLVAVDGDDDEPWKVSA